MGKEMTVQTKLLNRSNAEGRRKRCYQVRIDLHTVRAGNALGMHVGRMTLVIRARKKEIMHRACLAHKAADAHSKH